MISSATNARSPTERRATGEVKLCTYLPDRDVCVRILDDGCETIRVQGGGKGRLLLVLSSPDLSFIGDRELFED